MAQSAIPLLVLLLCGIVLHDAAAATYHVDHLAGDDERAGTSPAEAWRHCPGDPRAGGTAAATTLQPGDRVRFKGGVRYRGGITVTASGAADEPIVFDGNEDGGYGDGPAIVDGTQAITGWRPCGSAEEAGGNPRWASIVVAEIADASHWRAVSLSSEDAPLPVAQDPNPGDPMYQESIGDYHRVDAKLESTLPLRVFAATGTHVNAQRPLHHVVTPKDGSTVISPIGTAAFTVERKEAATVTAVGIALQPNYTPVKDVAVFADGAEVLRVALPEENGPMRRFELPRPVTARAFTFKLLSAHGEGGKNWTAVRRIAAWNEAGDNVLEVPDGDARMSLVDPRVFTAADPDHYDDMSLAIHAGHNFVRYLDIVAYEPGAHRILTEDFTEKVYDTSRYALFNSVKLIDVPGEYAVHPIGEGRARIFLMPPEGVDPDGIGRSVTANGFRLDGARHVEIRGFRIERQGGGRASGIRVDGGSDILVSGCAVRMVRGSTAISASGTDRIRVEDSEILDCPGHTKGLVFHTCTECEVVRCRFDRNTSTALDYYNCRNGRVVDNVVTRHRGMHANGLTFYVGCREILVEGNRVSEGHAAFTCQEGSDFIVRNNVLRGGGFALAIWDGKPMERMLIANNILISDSARSPALFGGTMNTRDLVVVNNIMHPAGGSAPVVGVFSHNIVLADGIPVDAKALREGERLVADRDEVFADAAAGDFSHAANSPALDAGTPLALAGAYDVAGAPRREGRDVGAYAQGSAPERVPERPWDGFDWQGFAFPQRGAPDYPHDEPNFSHAGAEPEIVVSALDYSGQGGGQVARREERGYLAQWATKGHWLEWTVTAPEAGDYELCVVQASGQAAKRSFLLDGEPVEGLEAVAMTLTGGWTEFAEHYLERPLRLKQGPNLLRVVDSDGAPLNVRELRFHRIVER